jgi:LmbE family N-acetylglucosaminyl deacetylase
VSTVQLTKQVNRVNVDEPVEFEVTSRGLPADLWWPALEAAAELPDPQTPVVVVVVPHPDDETLGAGGLLHRLASAGSTVTAVFVTDGAAGYPGVSPDQTRKLAELRRGEAQAALHVLGLNAEQAIFLELPDGAVAGAAEAELSARLGPILAGHRADLCLAPWPSDPHPDHQAVARAAAVATASAGVTLWQYPIWMRHSVRPDDERVDVEQLRVLRLSPAEQAVKLAAIGTHVSQLRSPFPGFGPVLPDHVLDLFADGYEPFFIPAPESAGS